MMSFCPKVLVKNSVPLIRGRESRAMREQEITCEGWSSFLLPGVYVQEQTPKGEWALKGKGTWVSLFWLTPLEFSGDMQVLGNS